MLPSDYQYVVYQDCVFDLSLSSLHSEVGAHAIWSDLFVVNSFGFSFTSRLSQKLDVYLHYIVGTLYSDYILTLRVMVCVTNE